MTSSRRSIRSATSLKPPAWRSTSLSKHSASASLSYVFAEPEQVTLPASAMSRLPTSKLAKRDSRADLQMHSDSNGQAVASVPTADEAAGPSALDEPSSSVPQPSVEATPNSSAPTSTPSSESQPLPPFETPPTEHESGSASSPASDPPSTTKSLLRRSFWFGSLSRPKENSTKNVATLDNPVDLHLNELSHASELISTNPEQRPVHDPSSPATSSSTVPQMPTPTRHDVQSSDSARPAKTEPPPSTLLAPSSTPPYPTKPEQHDSMHSNNDSVSPAGSMPIPSSSDAPPPPPSSPVLAVSPEDEAPRLSSYNQSSNRFGLSIPFLGRSKTPADNSLSLDSTSNQRQHEPSDTTPTPGKDHDRDLHFAASKDPPISQLSPLQSSDELTTEYNTVRVVSSTTWWDYVGWRSGSSASTGPDKKHIQTSSMTPEITPVHHNVESTRHSFSDGDTQHLESTSTAHMQTANEQMSKEEDLASAPLEIEKNQGSSWFSPWSWTYGTAISPADGKTTVMEASSDSVRTTVMPTHSPTAEEPSVASRQDVAQVSTASTSTANPIESTIESNRSGWISFFSSRSLFVKTVTASAPEGGKEMEIMDIEEDNQLGYKEVIDTKSAAEPNVSGITQSAPVTPPRSRSAETSRAPSPVSDLALANRKSTLKPPLAPPISIGDTVKPERRDAKRQPVSKKPASPSPSARSRTIAPPRPSPPNLVLPTWSDIFHTTPRNTLPPQPTSKFTKTVKFVSNVLFSADRSPESTGKGKGKHVAEEFVHFGKELPRAWDVVEGKISLDVLRGCRRIVVIGVHGWFPGAIMRTVLGEPTGTSGKFANMMEQALEEFQKRHNVSLEKITKIPLEGEGTINGRVDKLYTSLVSNEEWMDDMHKADAVFFATHSQGSVVSTHLLDRLIKDKHLRTRSNIVTMGTADAFPTGGIDAALRSDPQKICCLALCGIHLGPLRYLSTSTLVQPYIQYFESTAAKELFEFQNTESDVSKQYVSALANVLNDGVKMVYVASLNDQVVPIYSGLFTAVSHPLILRALYIDGDAYHSSDFLSKLLVLILRILNSGISDSGLLAHLSEATAGSLSGVGHSTAYEELATYMLAVDYLFLTNDGLEHHSELAIEHFNANSEQNDYEIPWSLRDLIADPRVAHFFSQDIISLKDAFNDWHPKTTILRDLKRKLQPIRKLPASFSSSFSSSKL